MARSPVQRFRGCNLISAHLFPSRIVFNPTGHTDSACKDETVHNIPQREENTNKTRYKGIQIMRMIYIDILVV